MSWFIFAKNRKAFGFVKMDPPQNVDIHEHIIERADSMVCDDRYLTPTGETSQSVPPPRALNSVSSAATSSTLSTTRLLRTLYLDTHTHRGRPVSTQTVGNRALCFNGDYGINPYNFLKPQH